MRSFHPYLAIILVCAAMPSVLLAATATNGPLHRCEENPRYFADRDGRAVLLTGSHVWYNLVDMGPQDPPESFDYAAHLDWLTKYHHNFMRMWTWEMTGWDTNSDAANSRNDMFYVQPHPWKRTGPGKALDGKPKFDLTQFDPAYFSRLKKRIAAAGERGIYVSVMLFEGWAMQHMAGGLRLHPFHPENNINGINGDVDGDGKGLEIHELVNGQITAIQKAYIRKVVETVNGLDNVLYEISNENHPASTKWQYAMIEYVRECEKDMPQQHPVGMTFQYKGGANQTLFDSPADWISPNPDGGYRDNPPAADGRKVIVADTDHLWGIGGNETWLWKSVTRGLNAIFMDPYDGVVLGTRFDPKFEALRRSMGYALQFTQRMDLNRCRPRPDLADTGYCLADPGREYLVYQPSGGQSVTLKLSAGRYRIEWFDPHKGQTVSKETVRISEGDRVFPCPMEGQAVLYVYAVKSN